DSLANRGPSPGLQSWVSAAKSADVHRGSDEPTNYRGAQPPSAAREESSQAEKFSNDSSTSRLGCVFVKGLMAAELTQLEQELQEIRHRAEQLVAGLTPEQLTRRPDPAKWSIAECLAHLNLTAEFVQPKIAAAIEQGKSKKLFAQGPCNAGFLGRTLVWWAEPPPKIRFNAPKNIAPKVVINDPSQVISDFMRFQDEWARLLRDAEGLNQKKIKVPALFPRLLPLPLSASIPWMLAHERRHLWQAENVKRAISK